MAFNIQASLVAQELAEQAFAERHYDWAKRFAKRARDLNPELAAASDFLRAIEILISGEMKVNGQTDRYKVLGVCPDADVATIRENYRNLAVTVHPDRNKSVAADAAFKTVSEAWSVLSREAARARHDERSGRGPPSVGPTGVGPTAGVGPTFWTACTACSVEIEYDRRFLNRLVVCLTCVTPFLCLETVRARDGLGWARSRAQAQAFRSPLWAFELAPMERSAPQKRKRFE